MDYVIFSKLRSAEVLSFRPPWHALSPQWRHDRDITVDYCQLEIYGKSPDEEAFMSVIRLISIVGQRVYKHSISYHLCMWTDWFVSSCL